MGYEFIKILWVDSRYKNAFLTITQKYRYSHKIQEKPNLVMSLAVVLGARVHRLLFIIPHISDPPPATEEAYHQSV